MGSKRHIDMSAKEDTVKIVKAVDIKAVDTKTAAKKKADKATTVKADKAKTPEKKAKKTTKPVQKKFRSKKYQAVRSKVDKTKQYDPFAAIELAKKLSYAKFDGSIEAHAVVKNAGEKVSLSFPHSTGKSVKVAVFNASVLKKIEAGETDFDVLLATPQDMPKLTKHARVLGPKGLMPNPKNGTLTPKPAIKKKELEGGKITLKTEKKAPLIHITIGKVSMESKALVENLQALTKALKGRLVKLSIVASMGPGVKVMVE